MYRKLALFLLLIAISTVKAGPPFVTDDPEPVDYQHWEIYIASQYLHNSSGSTGTLPHIEVNYGAAPNLQLHLIAPYALSKSTDESTQHGFGDTELGVKHRFVQETEHRPMVGVFPLLEVPTGDADKGLGSGHFQLLLPVWLQKSWGKWTSYGGGGYFITPGIGNRSYWLLGWEIQKDLSKRLTMGGEVFSTTRSMVGVESQFNFNLGGQYNFDDIHHLLFSAGKSLHGDRNFMSYVAYQWTFGPTANIERSTSNVQQ